MSDLILKGRKVHEGVAEGEALVTKSSLAGYGAFDLDKGTVIEYGHDWFQKEIAGKVLVFNTGKGSSAWSIGAHSLRFAGKAPLAVIVKQVNPQIALGSVVMRVPAITLSDPDPTEVISTGDWVKVDADRGIVEVQKR
jgi:uncharacterized protein